MLDYNLLHFPLNVMEKMIYGGKKKAILDIYYNENGYPKYIHDLYGIAAIEDFREDLVNEILKRNNYSGIVSRITSDSWAIEHREGNCVSFIFKFRSLENKILKKTVMIEVVD